MIFQEKVRKEKQSKTGVFLAGAATGAAALVAKAKVLARPENKKKVQQVYKAVKKGRESIQAFVEKRNEVKDAIEPVVKTAPKVKRAVSATAKRLSKLKSS